MKKRRAAEDLKDYQEKLKNKVEDVLQRIRASGAADEKLLNDLKNDYDYKSINTFEFKKPEEVVKSEMSLVAKLERFEARIRLDEIMKLVLNGLKTSSKEEKEGVREKLTDFINSSNIYHQQAYNEREVEVKNLLSQLDNEYRDDRPNEEQRQGFSYYFLDKGAVISVILVFLVVVLLLVNRRGGKGTRLKLAKKKR